MLGCTISMRQGGTFLRDAGFDINPSKEYAVSLEPAGETPIPLTGLSVEGITIHGQLGNQRTVALDSTTTTPPFWIKRR